MQSLIADFIQYFCAIIFGMETWRLAHIYPQF